MRAALLACAVALAPLPAAPQTPSSSPLLVSVAELAALQGDPSLVVLHVADRPAVFEAGHVPGARFVRYGDLSVEGGGLGTELPPPDAVERVLEAAGVSDDSRVVIYAASPVGAARAFFTLDAYGHQRVALLDGGLAAWRASGRPVATGPAATVVPGRFTPKLRAERLADAAFIQRQTPGRTIALIDVRPDDEFFGTDDGMNGMHPAGHIAGARQLPWTELADASGRFLPRAQLAAKLTAAGAASDRPVVAYCMVGARASVVYFVARHLGYDVRLYDGSIVDWGRRKLPVTRQ